MRKKLTIICEKTYVFSIYRLKCEIFGFKINFYFYFIKFLLFSKFGLKPGCPISEFLKKRRFFDHRKTKNDENIEKTPLWCKSHYVENCIFRIFPWSSNFPFFAKKSLNNYLWNFFRFKKKHNLFYFLFYPIIPMYSVFDNN